MVLVDTSVWIEVFRRHSTVRIEDVVDFDEIVTCLPVIQEVLQGVDDERSYRVARDAMIALHIVDDPMPAAAYDYAVTLYRQAQRAGRTVRSGVDCLIAACALRHDLEILHNDRDFSALSTIAALRVRDLRGRRV